MYIATSATLLCGYDPYVIIINDKSGDFFLETTLIYTVT